MRVIVLTLLCVAFATTALADELAAQSEVCYGPLGPLPLLIESQPEDGTYEIKADWPGVGTFRFDVRDTKGALDQSGWAFMPRFFRKLRVCRKEDGQCTPARSYAEGKPDYVGQRIGSWVFEGK
jgi:hypothetical protein